MDNALEIVGLEGNYQKILLIINMFTGVLPAIYVIQIPYLTKYPNFFVKKLNSDDPNKVYEMDYFPELCNSNLYEISKNPKKSIINWSYTFDLYCERKKYITIMTSIVFVGAMIGTLIILPLPDKYGRSKILKSITLISLILHFSLLFSFGPIELIIINFLGGFFSQIYALGYALFTEFFPKNKNGLYIGIYNGIYSFIGVLLCFFFMYSSNWRYLYIITCLAHCYYTYITIKYFIESPRWLYSVGEKEKCIYALTEIAISNGNEEEWNKYKVNNLDFFEKQNNLQSENNKNYSIFKILQFKSQRNTFIKITIIMICASYNYFGIILNLGKMKGNFYLNSIHAFLGELVAELLSGKLADKYGRIRIFLLSCIVGTIGYILYLSSPTYKFFFIFTAMIGYSSIFNTICIYTPEIYPTKIRNITFSYSTFISKLSPICVPILTDLIPNLIDYSFIMCGIIAGIIGLNLEETLGKTLIDIIPEEEEEMENLRLRILNN